mgnify:CR=1 FL=1
MAEPQPVLFVGAGPGDPELITVKGLKALQQAEMVIYAGSLVNPALLDDLQPTVEIHDSASLTLDEVVALMAQAVASGKKVVRLHTGDPALYGAIQEQMELLDERGIAYRVIPGVTAAFAAAASLANELTLPGLSQTLILSRRAGRTPVPDSEALERIAAVGGTLVLYLSVGMIGEVVEELLAGGVFTPQTPAIVVSRASWPDERAVHATLESIAAQVAVSGITRQAVIMVGEVLDIRGRSKVQKSKLYDPTFSHGYRQGRE